MTSFVINKTSYINNTAAEHKATCKACQLGKFCDQYMQVDIETTFYTIMFCNIVFFGCGLTIIASRRQERRILPIISKSNNNYSTDDHLTFFAELSLREAAGLFLFLCSGNDGINSGKHAVIKKNNYQGYDFVYKIASLRLKLMLAQKMGFCFLKKVFSNSFVPNRLNITNIEM